VTELADGDPAETLSSRIEEGFVRRLEALPPDTRMLLLTAAAEPLGDATLLWRAAERLGLGADPAASAIESGLITFGEHIRFRHPLVRSAAYRMASPKDRQSVHRALADVTDFQTAPRTGARGTAPRRRPCRTRTSPQSSRGPPGGLGAAVA